jgi:serine protease Do
MLPPNTMTEVRYGRLGVLFRVMTADMAAQLKLNEPRGVVVIAVDEQGGAKKAGIQPGDVITMMDGKEIKTAADLPRVVAETPSGQKVDLVILRTGKEETLSITLEP